MNNENDAAPTDLVDALGGAVRDNPLPAALIGMGLIWLVAGGKGTLKSGVANVAGGLSTRGSGIHDKIATSGRVLTDSATSAASAALSKGSTLADAVITPSGVRSTLSSLFERQPMLIGAMGLALGAGLAASVPVTDAEKEFLGDASAEFRSKAMSIGNDSVQRASDVVDAVSTTIANESRVQGLRPETLKSGLIDAGQRIKHVVEQVGESVQKQMQ